MPRRLFPHHRTHTPPRRAALARRHPRVALVMLLSLSLWSAPAAGQGRGAGAKKAMPTSGAPLDAKLEDMGRALQRVKLTDAPKRHQLELRSAQRTLLLCTAAMKARLFTEKTLGDCVSAHGWVVILRRHLPDHQAVKLFGVVDDTLATLYLYARLQSVEQRLERIQKTKKKKGRRKKR